MYRLSVLLIMVFSAVTAFSQQEKTRLSLKEAIDAAMQNNKSLSIAQIDEYVAQSKFKETNAVYLPQLGFSYTAMTTNNPLNAFGFKLQQQSVTQNDFNPDVLNHPGATPDFTTKLELKLPLLNLDISNMRNAAQKQIEMYHFKTQRTREYLALEVKKAYLQLGLVYKTVDVLKETLTAAEKVNTQAENYFAQGLIQKSDLLNAKVFVTTIETNLAKAKSNIANASDYLSFLMGKSSGVIYTVEVIDTKLDLSDSVNQVSAQRSDFLVMQKAIEANDYVIKSQKMSYLPKINGFGSYQLNDASALGFNAGSYLTGIQLSWDIFKGTHTKNAINTQILEGNKLKATLLQQIEQSQLELNKTKRDLADLHQTLIQTSASVEQAGESLKILQNRYEQGLVNMTDVLLASNQLSQQKLNYQQAAFSIQSIKAYLEFLTTSNNN